MKPTYHDPGPQRRRAHRGHVAGHEQGHTRDHEQHHVVRVVECSTDLVAAAIG